jgi:hypothetical protein
VPAVVDKEFFQLMELSGARQLARIARGNWNEIARSAFALRKAREACV